MPNVANKFRMPKWRFVLSLTAVALGFTAYAQSPLLGSSMPYPALTEEVVIPDTLTAVMVNHVGRHGARYPSGPSHTAAIRSTLLRAALTLQGERLLAVADSVDRVTAHRWGALDSLGMAEQSGIAARMMERTPELFSDSVRVQAISSYVPRCVTSMYAFLHRISREHPKASVTAASGPQFSPEMRFFSINPLYLQWADTLNRDSILISLPQFEVAQSTLANFVDNAERFTPRERLRFLLALYSTLSIQEAAGGNPDLWRQFVTPAQMEAMWAVNDTRQHLMHSASAQSTIPTAISTPLLLDIIGSFDNFIATGCDSPQIVLRFGHAETLMPLLALMQIPGTVFTGPTAAVPANWHNYSIVPMAANLQMLLLRSVSGHLYVLTLVNERPVSVGNLPFIAPWKELRRFLVDTIP